MSGAIGSLGERTGGGSRVGEEAALSTGVSTFGESESRQPDAVAAPVKEAGASAAVLFQPQFSCPSVLARPAAEEEPSGEVCLNPREWSEAVVGFRRAAEGGKEADVTLAYQHLIRTAYEGSGLKEVNKEIISASRELAGVEWYETHSLRWQAKMPETPVVPDTEWLLKIERMRAAIHKLEGRRSGLASKFEKSVLDEVSRVLGSSGGSGKAAPFTDYTYVNIAQVMADVGERALASRYFDLASDNALTSSGKILFRLHAIGMLSPNEQKSLRKEISGYLEKGLPALLSDAALYEKIEREMQKDVGQLESFQKDIANSGLPPDEIGKRWGVFANTNRRAFLLSQAFGGSESPAADSFVQLYLTDSEVGRYRAYGDSKSPGSTEQINRAKILVWRLLYSMDSADSAGSRRETELLFEKLLRERIKAAGGRLSREDALSFVQPLGDILDEANKHHGDIETTLHENGEARAVLRKDFYLQLAGLLIDALGPYAKAGHVEAKNGIAELAFRSRYEGMMAMHDYSVALDSALPEIIEEFGDTSYIAKRVALLQGLYPAHFQNGCLISGVDFSQSEMGLSAAAREETFFKTSHQGRYNSSVAGIGGGIVGCLAGSILAAGPWGCPVGGIIVGGGSGALAEKVTQAQRVENARKYLEIAARSGVSLIDEKEAGANNISARNDIYISAGMNAAGGAFFGRLGLRGVVGLFQRLGQLGLGAIKPFKDTGVALGRLTFHGLRSLFWRKPIPPTTVPEVVGVMEENGHRLWRILLGMPRKMPDEASKQLAAQSWRVKIGNNVGFLRWNSYTSAFEYAGLLGAAGGVLDSVFHAGERVALPYLLTEALFRRREKDEPLVSIFGAFASMFVATRLGVTYLGIDKGGTRLMFVMDRLQDVYNQVSSGERVSDVDWGIAAINYISGSIPGQIRGRWLKNILGRRVGLVSGVEVKAAGFASGSLTWDSLDDAERALLEKLMLKANVNSVVTIRPKAGAPGLWEIVGKSVFGKEVAAEAVPFATISQDEYFLLKRLVRPIKFRFEEMKPGSPYYEELRRLRSHGSKREQELARSTIRSLDRIAQAVGAAGKTKADKRGIEILVRNGRAFLRDGKRLIPLGVNVDNRDMFRHLVAPIQFPVGRFMPGTVMFNGMTAEEQALVQKLCKMAGGKPSETLTVQGGKVFQRHWLTGKEREIGTITPAENLKLVKFMVAREQLPHFVIPKDGIDIKFNSNLNTLAIILFCLIHDTLIGTAWDEFRGQMFMGMTPGQGGKYTLVRSGTTLPPREWLKLKTGWDKPWAMILDRFLGRDFIDPMLTKWMPLWAEKAPWAKHYEAAFGSGKLSDFAGFHVAPGLLDGGLFTYNLCTFGYAVNDNIGCSPFTFNPVSERRLAEVYKTGRQGSKRFLSDEDYAEIDAELSALLDLVSANRGNGNKQVALDDGEMRGDALLDLALGLTAAASVARQKDQNRFRESFARHGDYFKYVEDQMGRLAAERFAAGGSASIDEKTAEAFVEQVVVDSSSAPPASFTDFMSSPIPIK